MHNYGHSRELKYTESMQFTPMHFNCVDLYPWYNVIPVPLSCLIHDCYLNLSKQYIIMSMNCNCVIAVKVSLLIYIYNVKVENHITML